MGNKFMENWETDLRNNRETRTCKCVRIPLMFLILLVVDNIIWETRNWETGLLMNRRKFAVLFWSGFRQDVTSNRIIYDFIFNKKNALFKDENLLWFNQC